MRSEFPPRVVGKVSILIWYSIYLQCFAVCRRAVLVNRIEALRYILRGCFIPCQPGRSPTGLSATAHGRLSIAQKRLPLSVALRRLRVVRHLSPAVSRLVDTPPGRQSGAFWNCIPAAR